MSITREQAEEATRLFGWCHELEHSEAFRNVVLSYVEEREEEHDRLGTDVSRPAAERAEHHRALKLAREIIGHKSAPGLVARRKAEAEELLRQWKAQNGQSAAVILPDALS